MADRCKSCNAPIVWATTAAGKPMPMDATPAAVGFELIGIDGTAAKKATPLIGEWELGSQRTVFVSHFSTCPHAARHRRVSRG
jgi:hypothetical protein